MAYKTADLKKKAIKAIDERKLIFIEEVASHINISKKTFYTHKLHEVPAIKDLLDKNKDEIKAELRVKWYKTDNATLQMALMRLVCTDKERKKLAINYNEVTGADGKDLTFTLKIENPRYELRPAATNGLPERDN